MDQSKKPAFLDENAPSLTNEELKAASNELLVSYPRIARTMTDDPVLNQVVGNISFMLFKDPRKLSNGKPVYGFFKLRGNWAEAELAIKDAKRIIKEFDSKHKIYQAPVGHWLPITEEEAFTRELIDVKMSEEEPSLRDEVAR